MKEGDTQGSAKPLADSSGSRRRNHSSSVLCSRWTYSGVRADRQACVSGRREAAACDPHHCKVGNPDPTPAPVPLSSPSPQLPPFLFLDSDKPAVSHWVGNLTVCGAPQGHETAGPLSLTLKLLVKKSEPHPGSSLSAPARPSWLMCGRVRGSRAATSTWPGVGGA